MPFPFISRLTTYFSFLQETLFSLIDILSYMKVNQLQLYMQNTFTFTNHDTVWRNTTPYTPRQDRVKVPRVSCPRPFFVFFFFSTLVFAVFLLFCSCSYSFYNSSLCYRDIIKIDKYCKARYIELVPHIESLSGFAHW